jgi:hydrogenase expression/formation protein HypC
MCLGVPGRVVALALDEDPPMAKVDFGGVIRSVCVAHVPEVRVGEFVLVHVGFALTRLDEVEARRTFELLAELEALPETLS